MSVQALTWVFENSEACHAERLVLIALANHADAHGRNAFPSVRTIAREARLSESAVHGAIRGLKAAGRIRPWGISPWRTTVYEIVMEEGAESAPPVDAGAPRVQSAPPGSAPEPSLENRPREPSSNPPVGGVQDLQGGSEVCRECGVVGPSGAKQCSVCGEFFPEPEDIPL